MPEDRPPFRCTITVYDNDDSLHAQQEIYYDHLDNAMRAYGHAVEGLNRMQAKLRRETPAADKASAPKE